MFVVNATMDDKTMKPMQFHRLKIDLEEDHGIFVETINHSSGMVSNLIISVSIFRRSSAAVIFLEFRAGDQGSIPTRCCDSLGK